MNKNQGANLHNRSIFITITVVVVFVSLILSFITYLNDTSANIRRQALENLAKQFSNSVTNAHWQWQAEGRPEIVMLLTYGNTLGENNTLIETGTKPMFMNHQGWPKAQSTSEGCADIWNMVLNMSMDRDGFKIFVEYYDGLALYNNAQESVCRYRLSTGSYFEYKIFSGQVSKVK